MYSNKYAHVLHTLREEILAARNFGGSLNPPNRVQFGGINFGGSEKILNLAGIYFGDLHKYSNLAGINFDGMWNNEFVWG